MYGIQSRRLRRQKRKPAQPDENTGAGSDVTAVVGLSPRGGGQPCFFVDESVTGFTQFENGDSLLNPWAPVGPKVVLFALLIHTGFPPTKGVFRPEKLW